MDGAYAFFWGVRLLEELESDAISLGGEYLKAGWGGEGVWVSTTYFSLLFVLPIHSYTHTLVHFCCLGFFLAWFSSSP